MDGHEKLELVIVMIIIPAIVNSFVLWVQDNFLKGDKHLDARRAEQEAKRRAEREERREKNYNMGKGNVNVEAAAEQLSEVSEDEYGNIVIKKRINRQIEEGMYGADPEVALVKRASLYEANNDLDAVDSDEFDRILENDKKARKSLVYDNSKKRLGAL